jgi:PAS domain S-box-containing protein
MKLPDTPQGVHRASTPEPARQSQSSALPEPRRIVVADGDLDDRKRIETWLAPLYALEFVLDGQAALAASRRQRPHLVLAAAKMPRLDGLGLLREMRQDSLLHSVPIILLSERDGGEGRAEVFDSGADDYLTKPIEARELLSRIESHLKLARLRDEVFLQAERLRARDQAWALLASLSQELAGLSSDADILGAATRAVAVHLGVDRAYFAESDPSGHRILVSSEWRRVELAPLIGAYELNTDELREWARAISSGTMGVSDVATDPKTRGLAEQHCDVLFGAYASAPFSRDGQWAATLVINVRTRREWTPDEQSFLENVIARAWPLVERARANEVAKHRARSLGCLNAAAATLSQERNIDKIIEQVVRSAREVTQAEFSAFFFKADLEGNGPPMLHLLLGEPPSFEKIPVRVGAKIFESGTNGEKVMRIADLRVDPIFKRGGPDYGIPARHSPFVSYLSVPVKSHSGKLIGEIFLSHSKVNVFTAETEYAVGTLAGQAAIAIDNANLFRDLQSELSRTKQAETSIRRLAAIVESSDDAIISKDIDGTITSWNQGAERIFGYVASEIVGKSVLTLIPPDRYHEEPVIISRLRKGERIDHYETIRRHKNGSLLRVSLTVSPMKGDNGVVVGASKIARDITPRWQAETRQQALYEMLAAVNRAAAPGEIYAAAMNAMMLCFTADRAAVLLADEKGVMRFVASHMLSEDYCKIVEGHSPWRQDDPDPRPVSIPDVRKEILDSKVSGAVEREGIRALTFIPLTYERRLIGKLMLYFNEPHEFSAGELQVAQATGSQIAFAVERHRGAQALESLVVDRTRSLRQALEQMEEFSYSVSHDLRSPVRAMRGYAEAVLEDYGDRLDQEGREMLSRIHRNGLRMDRLIQDLLTFSRISRREITFEPVRLEKLIREVIQQYPEMHPARATIEIPEELPVLLAHEPSLTQVVSNLLSNAVKFVPRNQRPHVRIDFVREGQKVTVRFKDNGIGVKPQHQGRLFGMFERISPETMYEGTGIGLAIVRKAMERMNGKVGMESDGETGSCFWFELDAAP